MNRLALAALLPAGLAGRLPAIALAGGAAVALIFRARLHPGLDALTFATGLAAAQGWWLTAVVAVALPLIAGDAIIRQGTPHDGPLAEFHGAPSVALAVPAITGIATLAAGVPMLLVAAAYAGPTVVLHGLAPGGAVLATALATAMVARRLAAPLRLATQYGALSLVVALLWRVVG